MKRDYSLKNALKLFFISLRQVINCFSCEFAYENPEEDDSFVRIVVFEMSDKNLQSCTVIAICIREKMWEFFLKLT